MSIVRNFNLYLNTGNGSVPYINVNQYDQGEQWVFTLYKEDGTKYLPSTGAIVGIKADNKGIINAGTVDADGRVVINETQQMTAAAGIAIFELLIDGDSHGTANFLVNVEQRPGDNADLSDSDLSLIQEAVDSAEVIVEVIGDGDPSEVIGEHVDAWLDNHPEATTTVQDGAITAPKINTSLWDKLLVSESASGNPALFDDGADDVPVSSLKVNLEPIQLGSGDPSPSNIRPIYPANSGNLFDPNSSGTEWVTSQNAVTTIDVSKSVRVSVVQGQALTLSNDTVSSNTNILLIAFLNSSNTVLSRTVKTNGDKYVTATAPANAVTAIVSFYQWAQVSNAQLEFGSFASSYQPYQSIMVKRAGKNLWKFNNSYTLSAAGSWLAVDASRSFPLKAGTYTWSFNALQAIDTIQMSFRTANNVSKTVSFYVGTSTGTGRKSYTFTLDEDVAILRSAYCNGAMSIENIQIERGSEATEYEPYAGNSYPYSLGREVYGGTVDLATGVLTVTNVCVSVRSLPWFYNSSVNYFVATVDDMVGTYNYASNVTDVIMSFARYKGAGVGWANMENDSFGINAKEIRLRMTGYTSTSAFVTAMADQTVCYPLATPTTVQLTPTQVNTLLGYNNISSSGTVEVIYHADTKLYVDKMTAVDNAIIAPTEADFVATRNYTVNDLLIINNVLYKVTTNIASGSAITPNSNVQQTTLSALIKALS